MNFINGGLSILAGLQILWILKETRRMENAGIALRLFLSAIIISLFLDCVFLVTRVSFVYTGDQFTTFFSNLGLSGFLAWLIHFNVFDRSEVPPK